MTATLTKPLIVPEYNNGIVKLYRPDPDSGVPVVDPAYIVDLQSVLNRLYPGKGFVAAPNCCKILGADLFVSLSSNNSQAVIKLPGYLTDPAAAQMQAFVFTLDGSDYVGLAFDTTGNLYAAEGNPLDNMIVCYGGTDAHYPGPDAAPLDNYKAGSKTVIGNAGLQSYFGDMVFDAAGNLWVADYLNHRVVVFNAAALGGANTYHVLANLNGPFPVTNADPALIAPTANLFAEPEGVDFDADGNLWAANNNDGGGSGAVSNALTSLVKVTKLLQDQVLATANGTAVAADTIQPDINCFIYQVANNTDGTRPQFGGLQVDKSAGRLYVNEEVAGTVRGYDLDSIVATQT